jgi:pimeloyl-ACP methyl ester carboxylesterase
VDSIAEVVAGLIRHYGEDALVIGNSMGGLISILLAARHPDTVRALALVNPASPVASWRKIRPISAVTLGTPLLPLVGPPLIKAYRASHTPEQGVEESYRFVTADPTTVDPIALEDALEIANLRRSQPWSASVLAKASRSIAPYVLTKGKFTSVVHNVSQPTLLIHGAKDDVIQMDSAVWLAHQRPDWTAVYFKDLGHIPMIEAPDRFMQVFRTWEEALTSNR